MNSKSLGSIKEFIATQSIPLDFGVATDTVLTEAERTLGFSLPPLLKACYREIANGGFGPGYGVIGLEGGNLSDFGDLLSTYRQLKGDAEMMGGKWELQLLPFCSYGCNIFSCVGCADNRWLVSTFEEGEVWPQNYTLEDFFKLWISGEDVLSYDASYEFTDVPITNPFTHKQTFIKKRKRLR